MFELLFLGTSASAPSVRRGLPSALVTHNEFRFMIDCGEGTQRQLLTAGVGFKRLNRILITHSHLDHILGLAGLLSTILRWETMEEMSIYGGRDSIERIKDLLYSVVIRGNVTNVPLTFHKLEVGTFIDEDDLTVSCFPVIHRGTDSFGFTFQEKSRRPFLAEKANELDVPFGPIRGELVAGNAVTLEDGRVITPDQVLGDTIEGTKLTYVGDSGTTNNLVHYVEAADALVIESTYLEEEVGMAEKYSHLTASMAANLAKEAGVKTLYLTHFSRRYREKDILAEARAIFPETYAARDFSQFEIKKNSEHN